MSDMIHAPAHPGANTSLCEAPGQIATAPAEVDCEDCIDDLRRARPTGPLWADGPHGTAIGAALNVARDALGLAINDAITSGEVADHAARAAEALSTVARLALDQKG